KGQCGGAADTPRGARHDGDLALGPSVGHVKYLLAAELHDVCRIHCVPAGAKAVRSIVPGRGARMSPNLDAACPPWPRTPVPGPAGYSGAHVLGGQAPDT